MFFQQFYVPSLGHASYVLGSERTGEALVLDARRDVDVYFDAVRGQGMRIAYAVDTHGHNDYLTGIAELADRLDDITLLGSAEGELGYDHRPVKDGERLEIGEIGIEVLHTPGHTPEHISLLVFDHDHSDSEPVILLSGGALLVGDLARPDLLGGEDEAKKAAKTFCHVIQEKILALPDHVQVFPTHVAGSLCGGSIGSRLSTTIGYERRTNAVLSRVSTSDEFVDECIKLENLPAVPPYWRRMRKQNLAGPALVGTVAPPAALKPEAFEAAIERGGVVVDARSPEAYAGGHVPGALNVGAGSSFPTWAGTVLRDPEADVLLVVDDPGAIPDITWSLLRIGYRAPAGWLAGGMQAWRTTARDVETTTAITVHELRERLNDVVVLDVRQPAEWAGGHIPGALFITGAELPERVDEVPGDRPVAVTCGSGYRSSVALSLLAREGKGPLLNVLGGMAAWKTAGYPTEKD